MPYDIIIVVGVAINARVHIILLICDEKDSTAVG